MKTPEQLAEEYMNEDKVACDAINHDAEDLVKAAFLAGYEAAKKEERLKLSELYSHGSDVQKIASAYLKSKGIEGALLPYAENRFIDGYLAAKQHAHAALEEAEAEIDRLQSKLSDTGILTTEHLIDASKMVDVSSSATFNNWMSVKDRLPEEGQGWVTVYAANEGWRWMVQPGFYHAKTKTWISRFLADESNYATFDLVTHWIPLPKPPTEE